MLGGVGIPVVVVTDCVRCGMSTVKGQSEDNSSSVPYRGSPFKLQSVSLHKDTGYHELPNTGCLAISVICEVSQILGPHC